MKGVKSHRFSLILVVILLFRFLIFHLLAPRLLLGKRVRLNICLYSQPKTTFSRQIFYHQIGFQKLKISLPLEPRVRFGDCFTIIGKIESCSQPSRIKYCLLNGRISFSQRGNRVQKTTVFLVEKFRILRNKLVNSYLQIFPYPEGDLLAGIVLGAKQSFEADFYSRLRRTGTLHIIVASGFNVSLIGEKPTEKLAYLLGFKPAVIVGLLLIWFYAFLVGFDPPIIRASLMISILLLARFLGRRFDHWRTLFLVAWLMLMIQPTLITSVSFQLSLAALIGVSLAPGLFPSLVGRPLGQELAETLSAQLLVSPLIAWHFGSNSWISPLVNLLVLPLVPWLTGFGLLALLLPFFWMKKAFLLLLAYPFLFWIVQVIDYFGRWSVAELRLPLSWWQVVPVYLLVFWLIHKKLTKTKKGQQKGD